MGIKINVRGMYLLEMFSIQKSHVFSWWQMNTFELCFTAKRSHRVPRLSVCYDPVAVLPALTLAERKRTNGVAIRTGTHRS